MLTLKQFRKKYHLSQKELAAILHTTTTTLSHYENGRWHINQSVIDCIKELYGEDIKPKTTPVPSKPRSPKPRGVWKQAN